MSFLDRIGGAAVATAIASHFYELVLADPLLLPLFRDASEPHADRMAWWLIELFGGEAVHTKRRGGFRTMVRAHQGLRITEAQRERWVGSMLAAVDEAALPEDARLEFARYVETVSRLAMNSSRAAG